MSDTARWQAQFLSAVQGTTSVTGGMQVYRTNYQHSQRAALSLTYPTVLALLGDEAFALAACGYLQQAPKRGFDWAEYGADFAHFLQDQPALADYPYVAEIARFEWCISCANRAPNQDVSLDSLRLLETEDCDALTFVWSPGTQFVRSDFDLLTLYQAHRDNRVGEIELVPAPFAYCIHRPLHAVQITPIASEYLTLSEMIAPQLRSITVSTIMQLCDRHHIDIGQWLTHHVKGKVIIGAQLS